MPIRLYDNARTVKNEQLLLADFQCRSRRCYQSIPHQANLHYADHPRATLDLFPCSSDSTLVFIHGGYLQSCQKSDFAFIAEHVLKQECQCVLLEYDLAPSSSLTEIQAQITQALDFIVQQEWITARIILAGHSAGAHLTALQLQHPAVNTAILLSGIYDLKPIQSTHLNQTLQLSAEEIQRFSPAYSAQPSSVPYLIAYGADELEELRGQSEQYFQQRKTIDTALVSMTSYDGINHYSILDYFFKYQFKR